MVKLGVSKYLSLENYKELMGIEFYFFQATSCKLLHNIGDIQWS